MKKLLFIISVCFTLSVQGQTIQEKQSSTQMTPDMTDVWAPQPKVVMPGEIKTDELIPPPSDAIVLFDGTDLSKWESAPDRKKIAGGDLNMNGNSERGAAQWNIKDEALVVNKGTGDIQTKLTFGDFQLHIEWRIPEGIIGNSQGRGNSGIFLQGIYELQILDSYHNETYVNGQAGSIYKQAPPLVNAMRKPGEWNTYDVIYTAPTFREDGTYRTRPIITLLHNGVLVQNNTVILGATSNVGFPQTIRHEKGPIRLQAHKDKSEPISFRNIWIREL